jgi:hypothetical protein
MGVECITAVGISVGIAVDSGVAVGIKAARVCSTDILTHICVASIPISGVGAACGFGEQEAIKEILMKRIKTLLFKIITSPNGLKTI